MKPSFALDFRAEAIALLHRSARGWTLVGQTAFGNPDMDGALAFLRSTALGLSPGGMATKLILPADQILYLTVRAPGPDAARRRKQIAAALDGRTPYATADLIFDWWGQGDEVNIAVVAKETLAEAESFAQAHRFNPVAFVAVPDNGLFQSEPWFGTTSIAASILATGEKVERDQDPVRIIQRDPPGPEVPPFASAAPAEQDAAALPIAVPPSEEPTPEPTAELPADVPVLVPVPPQETTVPDPAPMPEPVAEMEPVLQAESAPEPPPVLDAILAPALADLPMQEPSFDDILAQIPEPDLTAPPVPAENPTTPDVAGLPVSDEAPMVLDADEDLPTPAPAPAKGAGGGFSFLRAFAARKVHPAPRQTAPEPAVRPSPALAASMDPVRNAEVPPEQSVTSGGIMPGTHKVTQFTSQPAQSVEAAPASGAAVPNSAPRLTAERTSPAARPVVGGALKAAAVKPAKGKGFGAFVTSPTIAVPKGPRPAAAMPGGGASAAANPSGLSPARPGARPIGLGARPLPQQRKTRYLGLILTCILLVLLALIGAWSSILASDTATDPDATAVASANEAMPQTIPAPEDEMLADLQDPADFADEDPAATTAEAAPSKAASTPLPEPAPTEPAPATGLAQGNKAERGPQTQNAQDEIFLAGVDVAPQPTDAAALAAPPLSRSDALPAPAMPPPPFGTVYRFDADGMIIPTPEGIATPEGVLLVAGRPTIVPPARPAAVVTAAAARDAALPADATGAGNASTVPTDPTAQPLAAAPVFADPALQGFRPAPRPESLQIPAQSGSAEDPNFAPAADSRFASLRPMPRPFAVTAQAAPAVDAAAIESAVQSASLLTDAGVLPQIDEQQPEQTASLLPAARPATAPEASEPIDSGAAEADAEPEVDSVMPDLPTSASVAKQATVKNAVNLSDLTLVGVFGSEDRRYALVRQPNGRLVKVRVGDRLDGGKVVAITTSEVTYQKSGRTLVLEMPRT